ncbi:xanthine/uracil permease family protein [Burkholderia pseudomallei 406e]|nr:hypothetical protein BMA721280_A0400 [Burkholderia mallei 2002721280]EDO83988.1 xanthine/uracil permease family protein [Burkholderia pseudomallei 406e]EDO92268.1 hypothetical protein BURPSPAST_AA0762 [Burkholderia pseudomallei Pasteur 52237]EDP88762.1 hypothetical protein BMA10399_E0971 [Burkholderia mallei ATCC 10399]EDU07269.1 hypothetical protein BURPS1655_A1686 [Burkholderia pseudomallei 1655]EEP85268.1 hypothetical protein BMAGB8_1096 [Burkholderia mallei GB8 horse 4]
MSSAKAAISHPVKMSMYQSEIRSTQNATKTIGIRTRIH